MRVREIPHAYIGRHCEVADSKGLRIYPPPEEAKRTHADAPLVVLGSNRDACLGFIAGYEYALEEAGAG